MQSQQSPAAQRRSTKECRDSNAGIITESPDETQDVTSQSKQYNDRSSLCNLSTKNRIIGDISRLEWADALLGSTRKLKKLIAAEAGSDCLFYTLSQDGPIFSLAWHSARQDPSQIHVNQLSNI